MPARATLALYTDGLVERRSAPLEHGISRAVSLIRDGQASVLDDLADQVMSSLSPRDGYQDDVVLLLYRQPASLELEFPADANRLADTRIVLRDWISRAGMAPRQAMNVLIATGEALANGIEHGYRDSSDGTIRLTATALADRVQLAVVDQGSWKPAQPVGDSNRGRGITLMRELMDDVAITRDAAGTAIHLSVRIN